MMAIVPIARLTPPRSRPLPGGVKQQGTRDGHVSNTTAGGAGRAVSGCIGDVHT